MFTGIITGVGYINSIVDAGDRTFQIKCDWDCAQINIGASIACSGVCLTVVSRDENSFDVTVSAETLAVTTAGNWLVGNRINLERALKLGDELGGHIVSGHVDGLAEIKSIEKDIKPTSKLNQILNKYPFLPYILGISLLLVLILDLINYYS